MRRGQRSLLWTIGILLVAGRALAQGAPAPSGDKKLAVEWADKADARFQAGDYQGAVDGITEAEKHARTPAFTLLKARALEKLGRLVEAQAAHRLITLQPIDPAMPDKVRAVWLDAQAAARKELEALTVRIPKLEIALDGADASQLVDLTLDGAAFDPANLGRPVPVNPGERVIRVHARDRAPVTRRILLREGATERVTVDVPRPRAAAPVRPPPPPLEPSGAGLSVPPALRYVAFGLGGAGLVAGGVLGGIVLGEAGELRETSCIPGTDRCTAGSKVGVDGLKLLADLATASFIVGGIGVAGGAVLWLLPAKKQPSVGVAASFSGLSVRGVF